MSFKTALPLPLLLCIALSSCATATTGNEETVVVRTGHIGGAVCQLSNDRGSWNINHTPESILIGRSHDALLVDCRKPGYATSRTWINSQTNNRIYGNALMPGGLVGTGIDIADGAAYIYPRQIKVALHSRHI